MNWQEEDLKYIWHPCSQMKDYETLPQIVIERAKGINLYDYVINCLSSNSCEFGLTAPLTKDKLETAFNCKNCINERMLDSYYLSFEPVVREKTSTPNSSKYAQNVKESVSNKGIEQWNYTCTYSPCNSSGHSPNNYFKQSGNKSDIGYCTKYKHVEQKYSCGDCDSTHTTKCKSGVTCKHYYTETTYDCNSSDNDGSEPQLWRATGCYSYRIEMHTYLSTVHTYYYSVIKPARTTSTGNGMLDDLVTAENRGENSLTLHINEETGAEEHYIGPDLENAITGQCGKLGRNPSSKCKSQNKYSLYFSGIKNEDGSNFEFKKGNAGKSAIGVLYLWFPEITGCNTVCENTTGETRYQCAENYCDSLYYYEEGSTSATQKRKAGCLISCGVQHNPNNCLSKINDINFNDNDCLYTDSLIYANYSDPDNPYYM